MVLDYIFIYLFFIYTTLTGGTINYFFFERWNIAELDEIRFYGVAPHWYFRPLYGNSCYLPFSLRRSYVDGIVICCINRVTLILQFL